MREDIQKRLEQIRSGTVPDGYQHQQRIGIAPCEWQLGQISDVVKNVQRPVPKPDKPYWRLGIRSHAKGTFHEFVENPDTVAMDELYEIEENDLIVNITFAWEHAIALANADDAGKLVSHRFPAYIFKKKQIPKYFEGIVIQPRFKEMLANISPGGAGRNRVLSKKDFLKLPCYIPPQQEQEKIAEILKQCDKVIELKQQLIEEERKRKKWLMQRLFDPTRKHVEKVELGLICDVNEYSISEKSHGACSFYYIDIAAVDNGEITFPKSKVFFKDAPIRARRMITKGDIIMSTVRPLLHSFAYIDFDASEYIVSTGFAVLSVSKEIDARLIYQQLSSQELDRQYKDILVGTNYPAINSDDIKKLEVLIPTSKSEQLIFANAMSMVDSTIVLFEQELAQWQQKKKALMQLLLTGIVRVLV